MSEEHTADETAETPSSMNRRSILKAIGTGALSVGGVGSVSGASPPTEDIEKYNMDELDGEEKERVIVDARRISIFKRLGDYFKNKYQIQVDRSDISAYDITITSSGSSENYQIAVFPLEYEKR